MTTIRDVAKRAGVSSMTVSRVINGSGYTSQATRTQVEAAVVELGYVPNALARQLRLKQTKTLALVFSDITNPFFTAVARGVEDAASEHGFSVIYCNTDDSDEAQARQLDALVRKQVDGVILAPAHSSTEPLAFLRRHEIPVVLLDRPLPMPR